MADSTINFVASFKAGAATSAARAFKSELHSLHGAAGQVGAGIQKFGSGVADLGKKLLKVGLAAFAVAFAAVEETIRRSVSTTDTYGVTVARVAKITGLATDASSRLVAVFQRYGVQGGDAIRTIGMLEKNVGKLTLTTTTYKTVGVMHAATTLQIKDASEKLTLAQMRLNEMEAKGTASASSLRSAQDRVAAASAKLLILEGKHNSLGKQLASTKSGEAKFEQQYGFALRDSSGHVKDANALILQAADYFNKKSIPATKKAALEATLFGRNWQALVPILGLGSKGIKAAGDEAAKLGMVLNKSNAVDLSAYHNSTIALGEAWAGFQLQISLAVMPVLAKLFGFISNSLIPGIRKVASAISDWFKKNQPLIDQIAALVTNNLTSLRSMISDQLLPAIDSMRIAVVDWYNANKPLIDQLTSLVSGVIATGVQTIVDTFKNMGPLAPIIAGVTLAVILLSAAIMANPIVAIVGAIIAIVGVLRTVWEKDLGNIRERAQWMFESFQKGYNTYLKPVVDLIYQAVTTILVPAFQTLLGWVGQVANFLWGGGKGPVAVAFGAVADVVRALAGPVKAALGFVGDLLGVLGTLIGKIADAIAGLAKLKLLLPGGIGVPAQQALLDPNRKPGVPGGASGGYVGLHGPELMIVGEKGPEYIVPNHRLGGGGSGGGGVHLHVHSIWPPTPQQVKAIADAIDHHEYFATGSPTGNRT